MLDVRSTNRLLAALPDDEFARIQPYLKRIQLVRRQSLYRQGERIRHVYFANGGVCVVTAPTSNATMVQVEAIGDEGMLGIEASFTDAPVASGDTFAQVVTADSNAEQLSVRDFRRLLANTSTFRQIIGRYAQATLAVIVQLAACNASHSLEQRCARWLLSVHDRIHSDEFALTHQDLALLLAVHRPTLSECTHKLQALQLIRCGRGRFVIVDRAGLQGVACECYAIRRAILARVTAR
jgi:CRP-like cAMP-binding protein